MWGLRRVYGLRNDDSAHHECHVGVIRIRHDDSMGESFPDFFGCSRAVFVQIR